MLKKPIAVHCPWRPKDLQEFAGISPTMVRDLRRRGFSPTNEAGRLSINTASYWLLLATLAGHGLGPKRVQDVSDQFSPELLRNALADPVAWDREEAWKKWHNSSAFGPPKRFLVIPDVGRARVADDVSQPTEGEAAVVTIVDLGTLAMKLRAKLIEKPSTILSPASTCDNQ